MGARRTEAIVGTTVFVAAALIPVDLQRAYAVRPRTPGQRTEKLRMLRRMRARSGLRGVDEGCVHAVNARPSHVPDDRGYTRDDLAKTLATVVLRRPIDVPAAGAAGAPDEGSRIMKHKITAAAAVLAIVAIPASPAFANHDHHLDLPNGDCATIPVGHQAHGEDDPGRKFHGGLHTGVPGTFAFAQGGQITVAGGAC